MIMTKGSEAPPSKAEALAVLEDTARAVKVMKASWLRVAINLKRIRDHDLWRLSSTPCQSYEEYVYGVLQINRAVARRMLDAMGYTETRRPDLLQDIALGRDDVHVPSYDVLNQLRRAEPAFEGREEDFSELESRVFDDGVGRGTLRREIVDKLGDDAVGEDEVPGAAASSKAPLDLGQVLAELKTVEAQLIELKVSKEVRQLIFRLVETLEKETNLATASAG